MIYYATFNKLLLNNDISSRDFQLEGAFFQDPGECGGYTQLHLPNKFS